MVKNKYLEAEIILELDAIHDREHGGRGGATDKEHLRKDYRPDPGSDKSYHNRDEDKN